MTPLLYFHPPGGGWHILYHACTLRRAVCYNTPSFHALRIGSLASGVWSGDEFSARNNRRLPSAQASALLFIYNSALVSSALSASSSHDPPLALSLNILPTDTILLPRTGGLHSHGYLGIWNLAAHQGASPSHACTRRASIAAWAMEEASITRKAGPQRSSGAASSKKHTNSSTKSK